MIHKQFPTINGLQSCCYAEKPCFQPTTDNFIQILNTHPKDGGLHWVTVATYENSVSRAVRLYESSLALGVSSSIALESVSVSYMLCSPEVPSVFNLWTMTFNQTQTIVAFMQLRLPFLWHLARNLPICITITKKWGLIFWIVLALVLLNKLRPPNFQPIRLLDLNYCYKFTYLMVNSADLDQLASEEDN